MFREHQIRINYAWILNDIERCASCITIARRQPASNLAQRLGSAQLAEQHCHELSPTAEPASVPFGLVLANRRVKSGSRNQL